MRPEKISMPKQTALKVIKSANAFQSGPPRQCFFHVEKMWNAESSVA